MYNTIIFTIIVCFICGYSYAADTTTKDHNSNKNAQGTITYALTKHAIAAGGGVSNGNASNGDTYTITSVIAQIDGNHSATGGSFHFNGGLLAASTINSDLIFKNHFE